jgi:NAD(P)-dependent dehydrogenase (short-subunit alcohol dehydrogenase family)
MTFAPGLFFGQRAVVVGGTSGIGAATALRLAHYGANVLALGLDAAGEHAPVHEQIESHEFDVTDEAQVRSVLSREEAVQVLVNCAGISRDREEYELEVFEHVLSVNLTSIMRVCSATIPALIRARGATARPTRPARAGWCS